MSEIRISYEQPAPSPLASFWQRFGAYVIDCLIWLPVFVVLVLAFPIDSVASGKSNPFHIAYNFISGFIFWAYFVGMESSSHQASLGKKALGIMVTDGQGGRISSKTATVRNWIAWVPSALAVFDGLIGTWSVFAQIGLFAMLGMVAAFASSLAIAFTQHKQGWHDIMAGCLVVRKGARFEAPAGGAPP